MPFLFFSTMSFVAGAEFNPCGNLTSMSQVSIELTCEGKLTVLIDKVPAGYNKYSFGSVSGSAYGQVGAEFTNKIAFDHGTTNLDSLSGKVFYVSESCYGQPLFFGVMPDWVNGASAGTYTYKVSTNDGKSQSTARPHDTVTKVPTLSKPSVKATAYRPSCPSVDDGSIKLTTTLGSGKCAAGIGYIINPGSITGSFNSNGTATISDLASGSYTVTFSSAAPSGACLCAVPPADDLTVLVPAASQNTASIACIDRVNISASNDPDPTGHHGCTVTIELDDIMLGVGDPCATGMVDYINVRDKVSGKLIGMGLSGTPGNYMPNMMTGSGTAVRIEDASLYFGKEVIIEVWDEQSGNHCWGTALIEDKSAPIVTCSVPSLDTISCLEFEGDMAESLRNQVLDCSDVDVTIVRQRTIPECGGSILKQVELIYFATDEWGNKSAQCMDTIRISRIGMRDTSMTAPTRKTLTFVPGVRLLIPDDREQAWDRALACNDYIDRDNDGAPDPVNETKGAGFPTIEVTKENGDIDTLPLPALNYRHYSAALNNAKDKALTYCKIGANYTDILIGSYGCTTKYMRTWSVYEWTCDEGELDTTWQQIIEIVDTIAPSFEGFEIEDVTVSVNTYNCSKTKQIKMPRATDNCTAPEDIKYEAVVYDSTWKVLGPDFKKYADGEDFEFPLGKNYVVYTAFDECHNFAKDTSIVYVVDKTAPVTVCKEFLVVGISVDGTVRVPAGSFDNGSYDDCALKSTCVVRMDDLDTFDGLDTDGDGWVLLSTIEANDLACNRDFSKYATERTVDKVKAYYLHRDDLCQPDIWFCCNDSDGDVMVVFRAIDYYHNVNECMVFVDIQDKTRPSIQCPPNVEVDCDLALPAIDDSKLNTFIPQDEDVLTEYFGKITGEHLQEAFGVHPSHVVNDFGKSLVDGVWFDNCDDPDIFVRVTVNFNQCNTGVITRTFYAVDGSGNRSPECTQTITVSSLKPFNFDNIVWPVEDTSIYGCTDPSTITVQMYGVPEAADGACMMFGTSYKDQVFRFNNFTGQGDACFKLVRTWSVIDWCTSSPYGKVHSETYTQVIKVYDLDGPTIECGDDSVTETTDCNGAPVELIASAFDDCTPANELVWQAKIDANNDGSYDFGPADLAGLITRGVDGNTSRVSLTNVFPLGTHKIQWIVEDRCGNRDICESLFTVSLTKAPTPFAIDVSTVLMTTGMVTIWASDMDNKSEGACGKDDVKVAIVRAGGGFANASQSITFTCQDFVNGPRVALDFYAYQVFGGDTLRDFTTVFVTLQDNSGACDNFQGNNNNTQSAFITGSVRTEFAANVPDVEIGLLGGNQGASKLDAAKTNASGQYAFPAMPMGGSYVIDPVSSNDWLNGVTTLDLVLIQRYILGMIDLDSPYKVIAADVNNDKNISAIDLVDLRSVILGMRDKFTNNDSWRFVDAAFDFSGGTDPLSDLFSERYEINRLESNMNVDFIGVKVGDVNGSVDAASIVAKSRSKFNLAVADQNFKAGDLISVPVKVGSAIDLIGFQFTSAFDADKLQFAGVNGAGVSISNDQIGTQRLGEGILTASWNDVMPTVLKGDQTMIVMNFKAIASGTLSESFSITSDVTNAEIYNGNLETMNIGLSFTKEAGELVSGFELLQNTPNPFADNTVVSFVLPKSAKATLTVFDVTGKVLKRTQGSFDKGINTIEINKDELASSGVLYYTLETEGFIDTKRMVVLK